MHGLGVQGGSRVLLPVALLLSPHFRPRRSRSCRPISAPTSCNTNNMLLRVQ